MIHGYCVSTATKQEDDSRFEVLNGSRSASGAMGHRNVFWLLYIASRLKCAWRVVLLRSSTWRCLAWLCHVLNDGCMDLSVKQTNTQLRGNACRKSRLLQNLPFPACSCWIRGSVVKSRQGLCSNLLSQNKWLYSFLSPRIVSGRWVRSRPYASTAVARYCVNRVCLDPTRHRPVASHTSVNLRLFYAAATVAAGIASPVLGISA